MQIISVPTEKFRLQNPIFHSFYAALRVRGVFASDFSASQLFSRDLRILQLHFPEHFAINFPLFSALPRSAALLAAAVLCKARRIPVVWTVHNVALFETRNMALYRLLMNLLTPMLDGCIFLSRSSQEQFRARFPRVRPRHEALLPHPSYPVARPLELARGPMLIGMIGEQKTYKRPLESLRLFQVARQLVDCRLLVAGPVHDPDAFRIGLSAIPLEEVEWIDRRLDDEELEQAARRAHFALLPYSTITNSGAAIYALSCGRPIVVSALPLFFELRERFGPAWVRIADGAAELDAAFWSPPTASDLDDLKKKLFAISLDVLAARHRVFFEQLVVAKRG